MKSDYYFNLMEEARKKLFEKVIKKFSMADLVKH